MKSTNNIIKFKDVCFHYGVPEILHNVSFAVEKNQFVALVGPNGGGKTTLVKLILGQVKPQRGSIELFGDDPVRTRNLVGYVPQSVNFDHNFPVSAGDIVRMGRINRNRLGRYTKSDYAETINAMEFTNTLHLKKAKFGTLSGGERQRILIAQALVSEPKLLLLDEPTANVDSSSERDLFELFQKLNSDMTILMVSHNLNVVTQHASHVLCVNHTVEWHELKTITSSTMHSADGADLALIIHNHQCPVHDASKTMKAEHRATTGC